jgi:periplasmic protein TonB
MENDLNIQYIWTVWKQGGWVMPPLFIIAVWIYFIAIQLLRSISTRSIGVAEPDGDIGAESDVRFKRRLDDDPELRRVWDYVWLGGPDYQRMELRFQEIRTAIFPRIDRRLSYLNTLTLTAPLLGLLGTAMGMLKTFSGLSQGMAQAMNEAAVGISEALISTQTGLCVALPGYALIYWIRRRRDLNRLRIEHIERWAFQIIGASPPCPLLGVNKLELDLDSRSADDTDQTQSNSKWVYHPENPFSNRKNRTAVVSAILISLALFLILPITQWTGAPSKPIKTLSLSSAPPPAPAQEPPPPEELPEVAQEPEATEPPPPLTLSQLQLAMNPGLGAMSATDFSFNWDSGVALEDQLKAFEVADLDQPPKAIYQPQPDYPYSMQRAGIEGVVQLVMKIGTDGRPLELTANCPEHPQLEKLTLDVARRWRFEPGTVNGRQIQYWIRMPVVFRQQKRR